MKFSKKYGIKIPKNTKIVYYAKQNVLIIIGLLDQKILNLKLNIYIIKSKNYIYVTKNITQKLIDTRKKTLKSLRGTTVAIVKQTILETSVLLNKKIKLIGVGYKALKKLYKANEILELKLGFSHLIYYKLTKKAQIIPIKAIYVYIFSNSYFAVTQIAAILKSYKTPEPYKGKGILYDNDKILIKNNKKV